MITTTSPAVALRNAELLLDGSHGAAGGSARLAAFLARQALEELVIERCVALGVYIERPSMRSRLVILRSLDTAENADAAAMAWNRLSNACHHHAYELAPTVAEVRHLCGGDLSVGERMTTELIGAGVTVFIDPVTDMLREHGLSLQAKGRSQLLRRVHF